MSGGQGGSLPVTRYQVMTLTPCDTCQHGHSCPQSWKMIRNLGGSRRHLVLFTKYYNAAAALHPGTGHHVTLCMILSQLSHVSHQSW